MIEKIYKQVGYINKIKAIETDICNRCLSKNIYTDAYGIKHCLDCYSYHEITDEMYLYRYVQFKEHKKHLLNLSYNLTDKQIDGSNFLVSCLNNNNFGFLQAVCGAGKTEMTFDVIIKALNDYKSVCFVTPRIEVLKEVYQRFKNYFPITTIKILFSENKDYENADLLFSTPQQLINFYQEFDLIILDEVDAYPYANNLKLERLVNKSLKDTGIILYMSATINKVFINQIKKGKLEYKSIVSRYHNLDLPVPKLKRFNNKTALNRKLLSLVQKKIKNLRSVIVFVPTINYGEELENFFIKNNIASEFISSKTVYRKHVIKSFRNKNFYVLIATTLLERGVTFKDIDCIVCNAEHKVFNKESLVQISGRVGRIKDFQEGNITFFYETLSKSIKNCIKEIKEMNRLNHNEM